MFGAALGALLVAMFLVLIRGFVGPSVYDRILAANAFGTKAVLFVAVLGFLYERPDFIDVALVYALINFAVTVAFLKLVQEHRLD